MPGRAGGLTVATIGLLALVEGSCSQGGRADEAARLLGRWSVDGQKCDRAWLVYRDDGSWTTDHYRGHWSLEGDRLTLRLGQAGDFVLNRRVREISPGICHTEHIDWDGADAFRSRWEDGTTHRLTRCEEHAPHNIQCIGDCAAETAFEEHGWAERPPAAKRKC